MSTNGERFINSHLVRMCGALGLGQTFGQRGENDSFTHSPDFRENEDENQNSGIWVLWGMCCFGFHHRQNSPSVHGFQDNPKRLKMSNSEILAEKLGQPTSASICVQQKIDLENLPHGFCAWLSKLSESRTVFGNSKWFRSWAWIFKPLNQNCNNFQNFWDFFHFWQNCFLGFEIWFYPSSYGIHV